MEEQARYDAKERGFEIVEDWARDFPGCEIILPKRSTKYSAGYDFFLVNDVEIPKNGKTIIFTDVKAYMQEDERLEIHIRSSLGIKKGLYLLNAEGVIDHDYYRNPKNDGKIMMGIGNTNPFPVMIKKGERIAQGIFSKYLLADGDNFENNGNSRNGGMGSTDE